MADVTGRSTNTPSHARSSAAGHTHGVSLIKHSHTGRDTEASGHILEAEWTLRTRQWQVSNRRGERKRRTGRTVNRSGEWKTITAEEGRINERRGKKEKVTGAKAGRESQLIYMPQLISVLTALRGVCVPTHIDNTDKTVCISWPAETEPLHLQRDASGNKKKSKQWVQVNERKMKGMVLSELLH